MCAELGPGRNHEGDNIVEMFERIMLCCRGDVSAGGQHLAAASDLKLAIQSLNQMKLMAEKHQWLRCTGGASAL